MTLKELRNNMNINLTTIKYEITDNKIDIMYKIDDNSYEYFIEMEWSLWVLSKV